MTPRTVLVLGYIRVGLALVSKCPLDISSDHLPFISLADANQCMRVSSALEAGTVSDLIVTSRDSRDLDGNPPDFHSFVHFASTGLGKPIQHLAQ